VSFLNLAAIPRRIGKTEADILADTEIVIRKDQEERFGLPPDWQGYVASRTYETISWPDEPDGTGEDYIKESGYDWEDETYESLEEVYTDLMDWHSFDMDMWGDHTGVPLTELRLHTTEVDTDYRTGAETNKTVFIKRADGEHFTKREIAYLRQRIRDYDRVLRPALTEAWGEHHLALKNSNMRFDREVHDRQRADLAEAWKAAKLPADVKRYHNSATAGGESAPGTGRRWRCYLDIEPPFDLNVGWDRDAWQWDVTSSAEARSAARSFRVSATGHGCKRQPDGGSSWKHEAALSDAGIAVRDGQVALRRCIKACGG